MIIGSHYPWNKPGDIILVRDKIDGESQPGMVLRKATVEEWITEVTTDGMSHMIIGDEHKYFFYEVSVD